MKKINIIALLFLCIPFLIFSCSKKNTTPVQKCNIITLQDAISGSSTSTYNLTYDNSGNISTIQNTSATNPYTRIFTYSTNLIMVTTSGTGNVFQGSDSIVLNGAGLITTDVQLDASNNRTVDNYTYDGNNHVLKSTNQVNNGNITTTTFQYTNGNLTSYNDGTTTVTLTYYTDKAFEVGDYLYIFQLFNYGAQFIKNTNLSKSLQSGSTIQNYNYTFDSNGKITSLTATSGPSLENVNYQYQCN